MKLEWTHDRGGELVHPQLPDPLEYLEISGILTSPQDADAEAACEDIVQLLLQQDPVGNAELLLVLADTPIPLLPTALTIADISTAKSGDRHLWSREFPEWDPSARFDGIGESRDEGV